MSFPANNVSWKCLWSFDIMANTLEAILLQAQKKTGEKKSPCFKKKDALNKMKRLTLLSWQVQVVCVIEISLQGFVMQASVNKSYYYTIVVMFVFFLLS